MNMYFIYGNLIIADFSQLLAKKKKGGGIEKERKNERKEERKEGRKQTQFLTELI